MQPEASTLDISGHWGALIRQGLGTYTGSSALEILLATTCSRLKMLQETKEAKASQGYKESWS